MTYRARTASAPLFIRFPCRSWMAVTRVVHKTRGTDASVNANLGRSRAARLPKNGIFAGRTTSELQGEVPRQQSVFQCSVLLPFVTCVYSAFYVYEFEGWCLPTCLMETRQASFGCDRKWRCGSAEGGETNWTQKVPHAARASKMWPFTCVCVCVCARACTSLGHEIRGSQPLYRGAQFTLHSMHQFDRYEKHFEKVSYCRGVGPIIRT